MAAYSTPPVVIRPRSRRSAFGVLALAGACLLGCADAVTMSRTETATGHTLLEEGEAEEAAQIWFKPS